MPVKIPLNLPAASILASENIFVMDNFRAQTQDIRPLRIIILNLMPTKEATETQLLRLIGNTSLQIEVVLLKTQTYNSTHTSVDYLNEFYKTFDQIKDENYDGLIITGAPVELMEFEQVAYWKELCDIITWADSHVFSTFYICWAAQAGLYYKYGINKMTLPEKVSGVFSHRTLIDNCKLLRGFDDIFYAPHSRHTTVDKEQILKNKNLILLSESNEAGAYIVMSKDGRNIFVTGHSEYDRDTLKLEYLRDCAKDPSTKIPVNYFPDNNISLPPVIRWRAHANLLFANWLNYYVYQETPFDLSNLSK